MPLAYGCQSNAKHILTGFVAKWVLKEINYFVVTKQQWVMKYIQLNS